MGISQTKKSFMAQRIEQQGDEKKCFTILDDDSKENCQHAIMKEYYDFKFKLPISIISELNEESTKAKIQTDYKTIYWFVKECP